MHGDVVANLIVAKGEYGDGLQGRVGVAKAAGMFRATDREQPLLLTPVERSYLVAFLQALTSDPLPGGG